MTPQSSTALLLAASVVAVAVLACAPEADRRYLEDGIALPTVSGVSDVPQDPGEPAPCVASVRHLFARAGDQIWHCPIYDSGGVCRDARHWLTAIDGVPQAIEQVIATLHTEAEKSMEGTIDESVGRRLSARSVLIRADARAPFGSINLLVDACRAVGIHKTAFAVMFETGERELQCWIPRVGDKLDLDSVDVRVELRWEKPPGGLTRRFREHDFEDDAALQQELQQSLAQAMETDSVAPPLTIDSLDGVPWRDVVAVIPVARGAGFKEIQFAVFDQVSGR